MPPIPADWLREPLSLEAIEAELGRHSSHPLWQRLKRRANAGDKFWAFRSPPHTWPKKLGAAGYALVRDGVVVERFTILRT